MDTGKLAFDRFRIHFNRNSILLLLIFTFYLMFRLPMDCLFNETLDLSQDDIQRTLSANLSHETAFHCSGGVVDVADGVNCSDVGADRSIRAVETTAEDDLLVNLDAFDMLTEFSDLDCHDTIDSLVSIQAETGGSPPIHGDGSDAKDPNGLRRVHQLKDMPSPAVAIASDPILTVITDFSPEWAPTEVELFLFLELFIQLFRRNFSPHNFLYSFSLFNLVISVFLSMRVVLKVIDYSDLLSLDDPINPVYSIRVVVKFW